MRVSDPQKTYHITVSVFRFPAATTTVQETSTVAFSTSRPIGYRGPMGLAKNTDTGQVGYVAFFGETDQEWPNPTTFGNNVVLIKPSSMKSDVTDITFIPKMGYYPKLVEGGVAKTGPLDISSLASFTYTTSFEATV